MVGARLQNGLERSARVSVSLSDEAYSPLNLPSRVPACAVVTGWIQALDEV